MLTSPQPLDWDVQAHVGYSIVWHPTVYRNFEGQPESTSHPRPNPVDWNRLPFEDAQLDKIPPREGIYMMVHRYEHLAAVQHDIVLYLGEATNLRDRLRQHLVTARQSDQDSQIPENPSRHSDRMKLLFRLFSSLTIQYCTLEFSQEERRQLERQLIGLFDPPFNLHHRAVPRGRPLLGRPGTMKAVPGRPQPAFST